MIPCQFYFVYSICMKSNYSLIRLFVTFQGLYIFLSIFVMIVLFIEVFRLIHKKEGFSGSLSLSDLKDVSAVVEYPEWSSMTDHPKPTIDISGNKSMDISANKYNKWRKNMTKVTSDEEYKSLYNTVVSSNQYITLPPSSSLSSSPVLTKPVTNYNAAYSNAITGNTYITSPAMIMTELPKLKEVGISSINYDTLYKNALR